MLQYYVRKILDSDQLKIVNQIINDSNKNDKWQDGLKSGGGYKRVKNNLELFDFDSSQKINDLIMSSLDQDKKFIDFTVAKSTDLNIISKTTSGGYYNPHTDNWPNGDYSTTVFLNDPSEYNGGELCLYYGGQEEIKIKLDAGWGVTYSTGTVHRVNRVISGSRYVSIFWTKSLIKDPFIRYLYNQISNIGDNLNNKDNSVHISNCMNAMNDPYFCINDLKLQILRVYASK